MLALIAAAVVVRAGQALLFSPENAFVWITPGAQGGFLIGAIMLAGLAYAPHVAQRGWRPTTLLLGLVIINTTPANPYFVATLQTWVQGKFLNFNGAAQFLSLLWPFLAVWFLWLPAHTRASVASTIAATWRFESGGPAMSDTPYFNTTSSSA
jgi:hypothetical protein